MLSDVDLFERLLATLLARLFFHLLEMVIACGSELFVVLRQLPPHLNAAAAARISSGACAPIAAINCGSGIVLISFS